TRPPTTPLGRRLLTKSQTCLIPQPRRVTPPRGSSGDGARSAALGGPVCETPRSLRRGARPLLERPVPARHVLALRIDRRLGELGELERREERAVGDGRPLAGDERRSEERRVGKEGRARRWRSAAGKEAV